MLVYFHCFADSVSAIRGIAGYFWTAIHPAVIGIFKSLPYSEGWLWPMYIFLLLIRDTTNTRPDLLNLTAAGAMLRNCANFLERFS
jgi:hypothetical protein